MASVLLHSLLGCIPECLLGFARKYLSKSPVNATDAAVDHLYLGGFFRFILHQRQELEGIANMVICEFMGTIFLLSVSEPAAVV